ncbi:hypothetical protein D3C72_1153370 [compost metagenome]
MSTGCSDSAWRMTAGSPQSPSTASISTSGKLRRSSPSMVNSSSSLISSSTIRPAPWRAHWRHNSDPIEPPAPVTITVRPPNQPRMRFQSGMIGLRPSRSSIATSFNWPGSDCPCRMSLSLGTVRNGIPVLSQMATTRCMPTASSEGMAITSSLAAVSRATAGASSSVPRIGRLCSLAPRRCGASSSRPTGSKLPDRRRSRTRVSAAWPAPRISTRRADESDCSDW